MIEHKHPVYLSLLFALFLATGAFAEGFSGGDGNEGSPYKISNEQDWNELAQQVNQGEAFSGKFFELTTNIYVTTMVGTKTDNSGKPFSGTFDGNNNTITMAYGSSDSYFTEQYAAPFRYLKSATIKNLNTTGSIFSTRNFAAGIAAYVDGNTFIDNCHSDITITSSKEGDASYGGLISRIEGNPGSATTTITNSHFEGSFIGTNTTNCGGLVGWAYATVKIENCLFNPQNIAISSSNGSATFARSYEDRNYVTITNSYYTQVFGSVQGIQAYTSAAGHDGMLKKITAADGNDYYIAQNATVTVDAFYDLNTLAGAVVPVVKFGNQVLGNGTDYTYEILQGGTPVSDDYSMAEGDYTVTVAGTGVVYYGTISTTFRVLRKLLGEGTEDDPYTITDELDWETFVQQVVKGETFSGKFIALENDISVTTMAGTSTYNFSGTFDGNDKTITIAYGTSDSYFTEPYVAPFRYINAATIKNLNTTGSIFTSNQYAAGIAGHVAGDNTTLSNCHSNVTINSSRSGDGTHGGLIAVIEAANSYTTNVVNSHFDGSILGASTSHSGGLIGWAWTKVKFENCLFSPQSITASSSGSATFTRGNNSYSFTDCYYTQAFGTAQGTRVYTSPTDHSDLYTKVTAADGNDYYTAKSATVSVNGAYDFNTLAGAVTPIVKIGNQVLENGTDYTFVITKEDTPLGDNDAMDEGEYTVTVTGTGDTYYGTISTTFQVIHELQGDGTEGSPYLITSAEDWNIFAQRVNNGIHYHDKYVRLEDDITVSTMVGLLDDGENRFHGTFDGAGNTITVNYGTAQNPVGNYAAPFSHATSATIKNLHTSGTIYTNGQYAGGIVGRTTAGDNTTVTIDNCSSDVIINGLKGSADDHGGLVGVVAANSLVIRDSYFNGQLLGNNVKNVGGLVGWIETSATLTNCLFKPASLSSSARSTGSTLFNARTPANVSTTDCYYTEPLNTVQGQLVTTTPTDGMIYKTATITAADGVDYYMVATISGFQDTYVISDNLDISPVVTVNGATLVKGTDYMVTYNAPLNGEYPITVEGTGDYSGSYSKTAIFTGKFDGEGTEGNPYIIASVSDWKTIVQMVAQGETFSGKYLKMTDDISVTEMIGSDTTAHYFAGTFDGNGHTLTVNLGTSSKPLTESKAGPFRYIDGATIKGLHVDGEVHIHTTGNQPYKGVHATGLVGYAKGKSLITNNRVSVSITSHVDYGDYAGAEHAGYIGAVGAGADITIKDCIFDGSLLKDGSNNINWNGGFIGTVYNTATQVTIENCLFNPASVTLGTYASSVFSRGMTATINNSYYTSTYFPINDQGISGVGKTATELVELLGYAWHVVDGKAVPNPNVYETRYGAITVVEEDGNKAAYINGEFRKKEEAVIENNIQISSVTFNRTFNVRSDDTPVYSTIMLPFSIKAGEVGGATFYQLSGFNKVDGKWKTAVVTPIGNNVDLEANTPYLLEASESTISFNNQSPLTLNTTTGTKSVSFGNWEFRGTYSYIEYADSSDLIGRAYGFAGQELDGFKIGEFVKLGYGAKTAAMRAYLVYNEGNGSSKSAAGLSMAPFDLPETMDVVIVDSEGKSIGGGTMNTVTGEIRMDRWFDLQGRKLNSKPTTKGTYYYNGKRVIIK